jgi:hypothetical protein
VLRRPVRTGARVWLENEEAAATVDVANTAYMLMLRLLSHSYLVPRQFPLKGFCIDLALGLMRAMAPLAEQAARLPAGPSNPNCNAGMSFTALRDSAPLPPGTSAGKFFVERLRELTAGAEALPASTRVAQAVRVLKDLAQRADQRLESLELAPCRRPAPGSPRRIPYPRPPSSSPATSHRRRAPKATWTTSRGAISR